ncbi:hypothetical protein BH20ACI3_BH20ACI3_01250 [soil metagenome]
MSEISLCVREFQSFGVQTNCANLDFLAGTTAKTMPDHTLPFTGNQDIFTVLGPICLCFFRHA